METYRRGKIITTRQAILDVLENTFKRVSDEINKTYPPDSSTPSLEYSPTGYGHIGLLKAYHNSCKAFIDNYPKDMDALLYLGLYIGLNRVKDDFLFNYLKDEAVKSDIAYWVNYYLKETKM